MGGPDASDAISSLVENCMYELDGLSLFRVVQPTAERWNSMLGSVMSVIQKSYRCIISLTCNRYVVFTGVECTGRSDTEVCSRRLGC